MEEREIATYVATEDAKVIRKSFLGQSVIILMAVALTAITFYFTTKYDISTLYSTTDSHTEEIKEINTSVNQLSTKVEVMSIEPASLQKQMDDLNQRMDRMENKQDQIYQILITMQRNNP